MFCSNCGTQLPDGSVMCPNCKAQFAQQPTPVVVVDNSPRTLCPKCGAVMNFQQVSENKKRGCLSLCLWFLLCLCTCFLILLIPAMRGRGSKVHTWAVCQSCGYRYKVK